MSHFEHTTWLLIVILISTKWMGYLFKRMGVSELVGELLAGVTLGHFAMSIWGFDFSADMLNNEFFQYASELGVILLLFQVGLESNIKDLLKVGLNAFSVAALGVLLPVLMGVGVSFYFAMTSDLGSWFIGATLAATSVGITAKILNDAGLIKTRSSQVILGAAVIDDVMGILLLVILASVASTGSISVSEIGVIVLKTITFFIVAVLIGKYLLSGVIKISDLNTTTGVWVAFALVLALGFAQLSAMAGLAPIIGAFMAGLILDDVHFTHSENMNIHDLQDLLKPLTDILLPIFFVGIGAQVKLNLLGDLNVLGITISLLFVAIVGKILAGIFIRGSGFDKLGIGIGMIPRGEVGLIFAAYGLKQNILSTQSYSVLVLVVLLTTILGPVLIKSRLKYF